MYQTTIYTKNSTPQTNNFSCEWAARRHGIEQLRRGEVTSYEMESYTPNYTYHGEWDRDGLRY